MAGQKAFRRRSNGKFAVGPSTASGFRRPVQPSGGGSYKKLPLTNAKPAKKLPLSNKAKPKRGVVVRPKGEQFSTRINRILKGS